MNIVEGGAFPIANTIYTCAGVMVDMFYFYWLLTKNALFSDAALVHLKAKILEVPWAQVGFFRLHRCCFCRFCGGSSGQSGARKPPRRKAA